MEALPWSNNQGQVVNTLSSGKPIGGNYFQRQSPRFFSKIIGWHTFMKALVLKDMSLPLNITLKPWYQIQARQVSAILLSFWG
jgi:hypothetical protein